MVGRQMTAFRAPRRSETKEHFARLLVALGNQVCRAWFIFISRWEGELRGGGSNKLFSLSGGVAFPFCREYFHLARRPGRILDAQKIAKVAYEARRSIMDKHTRLKYRLLT